MEQRLSLVTLGVADLARAATFYERLGWTRALRAAEGVAFYQLNGTALALWPREELARDAGVADGGTRGFNGMALAYNTRSRDEVDVVLAEAEAAGGTVVKPARATFWGGYAGYFADPDGFLWEVAHNEGFALDARGNVTLPD